MCQAFWARAALSEHAWGWEDFGSRRP